MKKIVCVLMALCMMLGAAACAEIEYSQLEKWQRQFDFGNGVKGNVTFNFAGEASWAELLSPLNGLPLEVRAIQRDGCFQYRVYAENGEEMVGLTQLFGDEEKIFFKSDLLPDTLLSLATGGDMLNLLANEKGTNPELYSAMLNLLKIPQSTWDDNWQPIVDRYMAETELWLQNYASAPSILRGENGATVLVRYDIPSSALSKQIAAVWAQVLQDEELLPLLKAQLTQTQQEAYLNPYLLYYYEETLQQLSLASAVVMERELTARGETIRTELHFPLAAGAWKSLDIHQQDKTMTFTLTGDGKQVFAQVEETAEKKYSGTVYASAGVAGEKAVGLSFNYAEEESAKFDPVDERDHEYFDFTLSLAMAEETDAFTDLMAIPAMELHMTRHLHSRSQMVYPVSFDVEASLKLPDGEVSMIVDLIIRSPWVMDEIPTDGAADVLSMSQEELLHKLTDLGLNGLTVAMMLGQEQ